VNHQVEEIKKQILRKQILIKRRMIEDRAQADTPAKAAFDTAKEVAGDIVGQGFGAAVGSGAKMLSSVPISAVEFVAEKAYDKGSDDREFIEPTDYARKRGEEAGIEFPEKPNRSEGMDFRPLSRPISEGIDSFVEEHITGGDPKTTAGGYAKRIGEFAGETGAAKAGLLKVGNNLIKKSIKDPSFFQKMLMDAAENPAKVMQIEQEVSAIMATLDKYGENNDWPGWARVLSQIGGAATHGVVRGTVSRLYDTAASLVDKNKTAENLMVADYIARQDEAMGGTLIERMDEGKKLADKYNMPIDDPAHLARNSELKEAQRLADGAGSTSESTRVDRNMRAFRQHKQIDPADITEGMAEARSADEAANALAEKSIEKAEDSIKSSTREIVDTSAPSAGNSVRVVIE
jgi:hypothetical protein